MKQNILLLALFLLFNIAKATNPIAEFYSNDNYPRWTDEIKWNNRINMLTFNFTSAGCTDCSTDFKKFEFARDYVYAQGGGVLYYPEGDYYFNDIATWGNSPSGKGLMLKKGVVILGETPTDSAKAVPWDTFDSDLDATQQNIYKQHGLSKMKTRFHFPFREIDQARIVESKEASGKGLFPYTWNFIGIMKGANETGLKDVSHVGVAWVQMDGAYIFFGFDANWAPTWDQSVNSWLVNATKKTGINGWNGRVPDGTHTFDIWCGVNAQAGQGGVGSIYPGEKKFVFGCRLDNACVSNYMFDGTWCKIGGVWQYGLGDAFLSGGSFRYASKIAIYGSNVFIANNVISISNKNFIFRSRMIDRATSLLTPKDTNLIFNYGYGHCIDVNKQLISQVYNRCDFDSGIQFKENIVIKDNWMHNAAGKVLDVAGRYMVLQHNVGWKIRCDYNNWRTAYGFTKTFIIPFQYGATIFKATDDFMNRFIDLGSYNTWIDNNWYTGTGSLANDGEGILIQKTPGEMSAFSLAITRNICGKTGQGKYMGAWDTKGFGYLAAMNRTSSAQEGWVGLNAAGIDASAYDNFLNDASNRSTVVKKTTINFDEWSPNPDSVFAAEKVTVKWDSVKKANLISWKDISVREMGYVVERSVKNQNNWTRIAYRPRKEQKSDTTYDLGTANGKTCSVKGDFNPSNWYDFLTASGKEYDYRVGTIYTTSTNQDVELVKYALVTDEKTINKNTNSINNFAVFPNPTDDFISIKTNEEGLFTYSLIDVNGNRVLTGSLANGSLIDISSLKSGLYLLQVTTKNKSSNQKIIKN